MTTPAITASNLTKRYRIGARVVTALDRCDLALQLGEVVVLSGPSGSGKTTMVHLLAGWERLDSGTITWPAASRTPPSWRDVAVIPQALALLDELTVAENITLPIRAAHQSTVGSAELGDIIAQLGLTSLLDRSVDQISIGERQRVMVARAMSARPAVILADEPTAHQDDNNAATVVKLLQDAACHGAACLIATRQPTLTSAHRRIHLPKGGVADRRIE